MHPISAGALLQGYYATGHVSLDNYIAQISGQAPNRITSSDCVTSITALTGSYNDVAPFTLDPDQAKYPGQVDGQARDGGQAGPLGGTDFAYPAQVNGVGSDDTNAAERPNAARRSSPRPPTSTPTGTTRSSTSTR